MSATDVPRNVQIPDDVKIHDADGHVEVVGLSTDAVTQAIALYLGVGEERVKARTALSTQVNKAMLISGTPLVSTASQQQVQRSAALREDLLERGYETFASLAEKRQSQESSARTWVAREREKNLIFTVRLGSNVLIPSVQLTPDGKQRPEVAEMVRMLLTARLDGWSLWAWLCNPTGLLSGEIPEAVAKSNPVRAQRAARRFAAELERGRRADTVA